MMITAKRVKMLIDNMNAANFIVSATDTMFIYKGYLIVMEYRLTPLISVWLADGTRVRCDDDASVSYVIGSIDRWVAAGIMPPDA